MILNNIEHLIQKFYFRNFEIIYAYIWFIQKNNSM